MTEPTRAQLIALTARVQLANREGCERVELDTKAVAALLIHYATLKAERTATP